MLYSGHGNAFYFHARFNYEDIKGIQILLIYTDSWVFLFQSGAKDISAVTQTKLTCAAGLALLATRKYKVSCQKFKWKVLIQDDYV